MTYDLTELAEAGQEYEQLQERLKALRPRLHELVLKAYANGAPQTKIISKSHYTKDAVHQIIKKARAEGKVT